MRAHFEPLNVRNW